jgi:hypothetical protein
VALSTLWVLALVTSQAWAQATSPTEAAEPDVAAESPEQVWPVQVAVTLGVGGQAPGRGFLPLRVALSATDAVTRTVRVQVLSEDGVELLTLGPAEVGPEGRGLAGTLSADALAGAGSLTVRAFGADDEVVGAVQVEPELTPHPVLVVLDWRGAAPADLSAVRVRTGADDRWESATVSRADGLPRTPLGWNGVGAALLGDLAIESWGEPEARAFSSWVERGGTVVLSVGDRAAALRRSLVGRLLGDGLGLVPDAPPQRVDLAPVVDQLAGRFGLELPPANAAVGPLARLLPGDRDDVLLRTASGQPLLVRRRHGLGQVVAVAVDLWSPPFLHAAVTPALTELALSEPHGSDPRSRVLFGELAAVRQPAQTGSAFAVLITYALLVGPGVYFLLRARKRGLLVWVVIPSVTVCATAVVPFYRLAIREGESTMVGVLLREQRLDAAFAVDTIDALVFSGGLEPKELTVRGRDVVAFGMIPPPRMGRGLPRLGSVLGADPTQVELSLPIGLWGARYVGLESGAPPLDVKGRVELSPRDTAARVVLNYAGPLPLRDAVVVYPTHVATMLHVFKDPIEPGAQLDLLSEPTQAGGWQPEGGELESALLHRMLFSRYMQLAEGSRRPFLVGAIDWPSPFFTGPNLRTRTFVGLAAVELELGYRGGFPFGVADREVDARTVAELDADTVEREALIRFRFPRPVEPEAVTGLRLRVEAPAGRLSTLDCAVWLPQEERWLPLELIGPHAEADPSRVGRVTLGYEVPPEEEGPDVRAWIGDGELLIRQRFVRRVAQGRDATHMADFQLSLTLDE